jgi:hypothetical protein
MAFRAPKASTTARGYDLAHRKARQAAATRHQPTDPCVRCGRPLGPMGPWLHYDHNDSRTGWLGFAHARCNIRAGASAGARVANRRRKRRTTTTVNTASRW